MTPLYFLLLRSVIFPYLILFVPLSFPLSSRLRLHFPLPIIYVILSSLALPFITFPPIPIFQLSSIFTPSFSPCFILLSFSPFTSPICYCFPLPFHFSFFRSLFFPYLLVLLPLPISVASLSHPFLLSPVLAYSIPPSPSPYPFLLFGPSLSPPSSLTFVSLPLLFYLPLFIAMKKEQFTKLIEKENVMKIMTQLIWKETRDEEKESDKHRTQKAERVKWENEKKGGRKNRETSSDGRIGGARGA